MLHVLAARSDRQQKIAKIEELKKQVATLQSELAAARSQVQLDADYHIAIVTTAALPWMTGTAVNPLLRAAHLAKAGRRVTLMVPWLHPLEQKKIFPAGLTFATPSEQEAHMLEWLRSRGGLSARERGSGTGGASERGVTVLRGLWMISRPCSVAVS